MLDRLPAWLRHALVIFGSTLLGVVLPLVAAHQDDVTVWLVTTLRLPVYVLPVVATVVGSLILRFTTATRAYGVGSATPPAVPVNETTGDSMAGMGAIDALVVVFIAVVIVIVLTKLL